VTIILAAIATLAATWFFVRWHFANAIATHIDKTQPESKMVADWLVDMAPGDPMTHFTAAVALEKTFDTADLERSIQQYEFAVAASPHDYRLWLNLGRARAALGNGDAADAAFRRASELAPNYSAVAWAYGNFLIRQGDIDRGFQLVSRAASIDERYASPAAAIALEVFDGDSDRVRAAMGDNEATNAALAATLASMEKFDEAVQSWSHLPLDARPKTYKDLGQKLVDRLVTAKRFRLASQIAADLLTDESLKPALGQVSDGGFEGGVKLRQAGAFEWKISEGPQPQIGLSDGQKHSGKYGLLLNFNSFEISDFREISQLVPVEPGATYEFQLFYRPELNTRSMLKWQIVNAADQQPIASTGPLALAGDWTRAGVNFTVPAGADGVVIRLVHEGCTGPACPVAGKVVFDDISIKRL